MTATEIKIALLRAGVSQSDIARECDRTPAAVHNVIYGYNGSATLQAAIARHVGRPVQEVFPVDLPAPKP